MRKYVLRGVTFHVVYNDVNLGHGEARRACVRKCSNDIIALMDADDISLPNRFKEELNVILSTNADIVGGDIVEFIDREDNTVGRRCVPTSHDEIIQYMKKRSPFNQVTVMFRKEAYEKAGGYKDWFCNEDYYLWIRMYLSNAKFFNTGTDLVSVRVGDDMYARRGGDRYYESEIGIQKLMLKEKIIDKPTYFSNCTKRFIVQKLLPVAIRAWVFKMFARS